MPDKPPRMFLVPSPRLGLVDDVMPERLTAGLNEWITLSREVLAKKRAAAEKGWQPTSEISEDHNELRPFGAQYCPALQENNSMGYVLKWPASAVFKRTGPRAWEIHSADTNQFYKHHGMTSFPEAGESDVLSIGIGWIVVTPPGWSVLVKNIPNNLSGWKHGIQFAEGVIRTDQATIPIQVHAFVPPNAPAEITVTRGEPMCVVFPYRRDRIDMAVMSDPASVADAVREAKLDHETFANAPGRYKALYIDDTNLSTLYPALEARFEKGGR
jgi:hypothetical protein